MKSLLKLHTLTLLGLALAANVGLQLLLAVGQIKSWGEIDWMDVVGEGGCAALALAWLIMLLHSRPAGRVTRLLALGLACICFSWWMDLLDEFIQIPANIAWDNWLETAPMPVGLILLTFGIYHLNQEQRAINAQMHKRERLFREHRLFDNLTPLGTAEYLRRQLDSALRQAADEQRPLSLLAVDLDESAGSTSATARKKATSCCRPWRSCWCSTCAIRTCSAASPGIASSCCCRIPPNNRRGSSPRSCRLPSPASRTRPASTASACICVPAPRW